MEKWKVALVVVCIAVVTFITAVILTLMTQGPEPSCQIWITADFSDPDEIDEGVWKIVVEDIHATCETEYEDVAHYDVILREVNDTLIPLTDLRRGYVASHDNTFIFFEDNGEVGRLGSGDSFYIVGLESQSNYSFHLIFEPSAEIVNTTYIET